MKFHLDLIKEINFLRKNPSGYAEKILSYKNYFKGNVFKIPGQKIEIVTEEGFAAYEEAIQFLKSNKPSKELIPSKALGRIANDYIEELRKNPDKEDEIDMNSIIQKYGSFTGIFLYSIDYGSDTPELVVINFLVCDGDKSRSNRNSILNPELKKVGVASGKHDIYKYETFIVCCTDFQNSFDKNDNVNFEVLINDGTEHSIQDTNLLKNNDLSKENEEYIINDPNVVSFERRDWIVVDSGKRKKKIMYIKKYKDGKKKKEIKYILL